MLKSLPFEGTIKVRNKGVDISILADSDTAELAFAASRQLVVCGISTAVLEITCFEPIDTRTLKYYEKTTPCLLAMTEKIFDAVQPLIGSNTRMILFDGNSTGELVHAVRDGLGKN